MSTTAPLISVITPVRNGEQHIATCLASLQNQTYRNFEHIVIDGASTDKTVAYLQSYSQQYPLSWISEPDNGMYQALEKGFAKAQGEIFCWLNHDDIYFPWTLETVAKTFERYPQVDWITGIPSLLSESGRLFGLAHFVPVVPRSLIHKGHCHGRAFGFLQQESIFWRKSLWSKAGHFPADKKLSGDYWLWRSFAKTTPLYTIDTILAAFRERQGQLSGQGHLYYKEIGEPKAWPSLLRKSLRLLSYLLWEKKMILYSKHLENLPAPQVPEKNTSWH